MAKTIKAVFGVGECTKVCPQWQYDYNTVLQFVGLDLPQNYEVDLSNSKTGQSVTVLGNADGCVIPAQFFIPGSSIFAWVFVAGEDFGYTRAQVEIPISPRAVHTGDEPTPEQQAALDAAIALLNAATEAIPDDIEAALAEAKASGEFDGADGYSPSASVSKVGNTATITITDANGMTTATVTDGQNGVDGNQIWWTSHTITPPPLSVISISNITGGTGSPKSGDYLIGPVANGSSQEPTYLYSIAEIVGGLASLTAIGSIKGATGSAATVSVGTTTTLAAGSDATVTNSGTSTAAVFNFGIPKGATGPQGHGVSDDLRAALVQLASKVAYIDDGGADYYQDLYDALYNPPDVVSISAVFNQGTTKVYSDTPLDDLKPMLTVFALFDDNTQEVATNYTLTGTLTSATSTVTVSYLGKTTTFDVAVTILSSISAVYTQGIAVFTDESIDSLKADLVVTANYSDGDTETLDDADYTLSGTLTAGTSTITVAYGGKTDTFTVTTVSGVPISSTPISVRMTSNGAGSSWNSTTRVGSINANGTSQWPGCMVQGLSYLWSQVSSGIVKVEFDYTLTGYSSGNGVSINVAVYDSANPANNGAARKAAKGTVGIKINRTAHYCEKLDLSTLSWSDYNSNYFGLGILVNANSGCNFTFSNLDIKVAV